MMNRSAVAELVQPAQVKPEVKAAIREAISEVVEEVILPLMEDLRMDLRGEEDYTVDEIAKKLRVTPHGLRKKIRSGKIDLDFYEEGKKMYIPRESWHRFRTPNRLDDQIADIEYRDSQRRAQANVTLGGGV